MPLIAAGRTERGLQVALEAASCGTAAIPRVRVDRRGGRRAAVLHFSPTARELRDGDLVLVDAGAEHPATRATSPVRTRSVDVHRRAGAVHDTVRAPARPRSACRPGIEWHDVHRAAALVVAEGVELGGLRGSPETLVESGAATLSSARHRPPGRPRRPRHGAASRAREPSPACRACASTSLAAARAWTVEPGNVVPTLLGGNATRRDRLQSRGQLQASAACASSERLITDDGLQILAAASPLDVDS